MIRLLPVLLNCSLTQPHTGPAYLRRVGGRCEVRRHRARAPPKQHHGGVAQLDDGSARERREETLAARGGGSAVAVVCARATDVDRRHERVVDDRRAGLRVHPTV